MIFLIRQIKIFKLRLKMELEKKVELDFVKNPWREEKCFAFEVIPGDLPYEIYGKDCIDIAKEANTKHIDQHYIKAFRKKSNGEFVKSENELKKQQFITLKVVAPEIIDGKTYYDKIPIEDIFPKIKGIATWEPKAANLISELFENRGYEIIKKYR